MTFLVESIPNVEYAAVGGVALLADLHLPKDAGAPLPVILWVHGGGWRYGNRRLAPDLTRFFARDGFAMVAVEYRLSHQAIFPAPLDDLRTAIRWVRAAAGTYGFDADRIGLLGSSAGGHLSALAALTDPAPLADDALYREHSGAVHAVVDGYAPTDFLQIDAHRLPESVVSEDPETLLLPRGMTRSAQADSFESLLLGAAIGACPDRVRDANPVTWVRPGAPPFLILHGLSDTTVPVHQSELLYDALARHGNDVTFCAIDGLGHGFLNRTHLDDGPPRRMTVRRSVSGAERIEQLAQPIFPAIETFFRTHLAARRPAVSAWTAAIQR